MREPTTWQEGAESAAWMLGAQYVEVDLLGELRAAYDSYPIDQIDYIDVGGRALAGLVAHSAYNTSSELLDATILLVVTKQLDYGSDNIKRFGDEGLAIRIHDKIARLENLAGRDSPMHEALSDSWQDVLGYCLIGIMHRHGWFTLPIRGDRHEAMLLRQTRWDEAPMASVDSIYR